MAEHLTNRDVLSLLTVYIEDIAQIEMYRSLFGDNYVEKNIGLQNLKSLLRKVDLLARSFNDTYVAFVNNRYLFSSLRIISEAEMDDIDYIKQKSLFISTLAEGFNDILTSATTIHGQSFPKTEDYDEIAKLHDDMVNLLYPSKIGAVSIPKQIDSRQDLPHLSHHAPNYQDLEWLPGLFPKIAKTLDQLDDDHKTRILEHIRNLIKADQQMFPSYIDRDYLNTILYVALMSVLGSGRAED